MFHFLTYSRLLNSTTNSQLSHIYLSMSQAYKCYSCCWEFLSLPRSSSHLRNTFLEMILLSMTLPSGMNLDQENSEYQTQCHSLLSFQPCLSFCAPLKAIFYGRSVLMLWFFSVYTSLRLSFQHSQIHHSLVVLHWLLHPFDFWAINSHTSYYTVIWPKFSSLPWECMFSEPSTAWSLLSWIKSSWCIISRTVFAFQIIPFFESFVLD